MHISTTRRPVAVVADRGDGPRTTLRPPTRAITPIPTGPGNLLARKAH